MNILKITLILFFIVLTEKNFANINIIESGLKKLASPEFEGRKAGHIGNKKAVNFINDFITSSGLETLAENPNIDFTIFTEMEKSGENYLKQSNGALESKFQPLSYSLSGELKNAHAVFVGYGITIPKNDEKLKYDDYENIDVKGKIVLILTGDPGIKNPSSLFRHPDYLNYRSVHYKLKNAINHGALGAVLLDDPLSMSDFPNEKDPVFKNADGGGERFNIIAGFITNSWAKENLGLDTLQLQLKIKETQTPKSVSIHQQLDLKVGLTKKTGRVSNIAVVINGSDPVLSKEVVVLGAHLDHLGYGGESSLDDLNNSSLSTKEILFRNYKLRFAKFFSGKIHYGADDNASGSALIMELASKIKNLNLKRTHVIVWFNAEEIGLLGSANFIELWPSMFKEKYGTVVGMLNYDMVGRYTNTLSIMGTDTSKNWVNILTPIKSDLNIEFKKTAVGSSDHASFINKKIPSLFFTTGSHLDYHTSRDTADKINFSALMSLSKYSEELLLALDKETLSFNNEYDSGDSDSRPRGYGAHLGCVPEFGQSDSIKGVVCMKASPNSPAEKAGIVSGDILIKIGEIVIDSVYDLAFALKYYRAGDVVSLVYKRGEATFVKEVTLEKSKRE